VHIILTCIWRATAHKGHIFRFFVMFVILSFFHLAIALSALLRYTDSDYPFRIFKLFFLKYTSLYIDIDEYLNSEVTYIFFCSNRKLGDGPPNGCNVKFRKIQNNLFLYCIFSILSYIFQFICSHITYRRCCVEYK
jgi:hypothetical protein